MTLRPILEALPLCPAAELMGEGPARSRFARSIEVRGLASIGGEVLRILLAWAVAHERWDFVQRTAQGPDRALYRFDLPEGRFYAVVTGQGAPVACFGPSIEGAPDA
ncbi:hypothetical protein [Sulfitobacter dubius]|uniref:hypothetical protein n=1 Tax=Sulfitobacter dubius TaxID=218673 RepID=UPI0030DB08EA